jgi:hypothetical protein
VHKAVRTAIWLLAAVVPVLPQPRPTVPDGSAVRDFTSSHGQSFVYRYDSNRNALADSARAKDAILAVTMSGDLVRYDARELTPAGDLAPDEPLTFITALPGEIVLAGGAGGTVFRVDARTLALSPIARFPGEIFWIGRRSDRELASSLVVVTRTARWDDGDGWRRSVWSYVVHDQATGRSAPLGIGVDQLHLDPAGVLWIGRDRGEFGGAIHSLDLASGRLTDFDRACGVASEQERKALEELLGYPLEGEWGCEGVYGFHDGGGEGLLVHGGTSHNGIHHGYIASIAGESIHVRAEFGGVLRSAASNDERPASPITHVIDDGRGGLIVLSYDGVFRTDSAFAEWEKVSELDVRYTPGRPDALGSYPAVVDVHRIDGDPPLLALATQRDGLVGLRGGSVTTSPVHGQLEAEHVETLRATSTGLMAIERSSFWEDAIVWRRDDAGWTAVQLEAPVPSELTPWRLEQVVVPADRELIAVYKTFALPSPVLTVRWSQAGAQVLDSDTLTQTLENGALRVFLTGDGAVWALGGEWLYRLAGDRWVRESEALDKGMLRFHPPGVRFVLRRGGVSYLVARGAPWLWQLRHSSAGEPARIAAYRFAGDGPPPSEVRDAVRWGDGALLLATDEGLELLDLATARLVPAELSVPHGDIQLLAVDRSGTVWAAGDGLWMIPRQGPPHDLSRLALRAGPSVTALAPNPHEPAGVVVAADGSGLLYVRPAS